MKSCSEDDSLLLERIENMRSAADITALAMGLEFSNSLRHLIYSRGTTTGSSTISSLLLPLE